MNNMPENTKSPEVCGSLSGTTGSALSLGEILGWPSGDKVEKPRKPVDEMEIFKSAIWEYVMASQVNIPTDRVQNAWNELKRIATECPPNAEIPAATEIDALPNVPGQTCRARDFKC